MVTLDYFLDMLGDLGGVSIIFRANHGRHVLLLEVCHAFPMFEVNFRGVHHILR